MRFGISMRPRRGKIVPVPAAAPAAFPPPEPVKARVLPVRTWPTPGAPAPGRLTADGLERSVVGAMQGLSRNGREQLHRVAQELAAVEARGGIVCGVYVSTGPRVAPTPPSRRGGALPPPPPARGARPLAVLVPLMFVATLAVAAIAELRLGGTL